MLRARAGPILFGNRYQQYWPKALFHILFSLLAMQLRFPYIQLTQSKL